jgi:NAD-dependent deacetylase
MIEYAVRVASEADIFMIVGTSLAVYPAAGLLDYAPEDALVYLVDPNHPEAYFSREINFIQAAGSIGVPALADHLLGTGPLEFEVP